MRVVAWIRVLLFAAATLTMACLVVAGRVVLFASPRGASRWAAACCRAWCLAGCRLLGVRRSVIGRPPRGAFVAASNHLSYLDILVVGSLWPGVFVAKHEIASWPLFGIAARLSGTIFVDRDSPRELVRVSEEVRHRLRDGLPVTLFAEGGISIGNRIRPFLPSLLAPAARDGIPCHAVSLSYSSDDPTVDPSTEICWPTDVPLIRHVVGIAAIRDVTVEVHVAEKPIVSSDRKHLARTLHAWSAQRFRPVRGAPVENTCAP